MKLSVLERLRLQGFLPVQGSFVTAKTVHDLRMKLAFTGDEQDVLSFEVLPDGRVRWEDKAADEVGEMDILLTNREKKLIVEALEKANSTQTLTAQDVTVYEKFIPSEEGSDA